MSEPSYRPSRYWMAMKEDGFVERIWSDDLECELLPVEAIVLPEGQRVATLDFVLAPVPDSPNQYFVEVEDMDGCGVKLGEHVVREDGFHAIRFQAVIGDDDE